MVFRRCPQCGSTSDDQYGFCIKCGHEFEKIQNSESACPLCGYSNPDEADYCVKCGSPLVFKKKFEGPEDSTLNPIVIRKEVISNASEIKKNRTSKWLILAGYIFSILGGLLGVIIAIYLITRKDPVAKRHGIVQLAIFIFYLVVVGIMYALGMIPHDIFANYNNLILGNFTLR